MSEQLPPLPLQQEKLHQLFILPTEDMVSPQYTGAFNVEPVLPLEVEIKLEDNEPYTPEEEIVERTRPRARTSLCVLTKKFVDLIKAAPDGILELNTAAATLGVEKRRLYDITSALSGLNLIEKKGRNYIQWVGYDLKDSEAESRKKKLQEELSELAAIEENLDVLIKGCDQQLVELTCEKENARLAYVTCQDISSISVFHEQDVFAVKVSEEMRLIIPVPQEKSCTLHLKSTKGPIEVSLCDEKQRYSSDMWEYIGGAASAGKDAKHLDKKENPLQQSEELLETSNEYSCGEFFF